MQLFCHLNKETLLIAIWIVKHLPSLNRKQYWYKVHDLFYYRFSTCIELWSYLTYIHNWNKNIFKNPFDNPEELLTKTLILEVLKDCNLNNLEQPLPFCHFSMFCMELKFRIKSASDICNNHISNSQIYNSQASF